MGVLRYPRLVDLKYGKEHEGDFIFRNSKIRDWNGKKVIFQRHLSQVPVVQMMPYFPKPRCKEW